QIGQAVGEGGDVLQQGQAVVAYGRIFIHHQHIIKKAADGGLEGAQRGHKSRHRAVLLGGSLLVSRQKFLLGGQGEGSGTQRKRFALAAGDAYAAGIGIQQLGPILGGNRFTERFSHAGGGVRVVAQLGQDRFNHKGGVAHITQHAFETAVDKPHHLLQNSVIAGHGQQVGGGGKGGAQVKWLLVGNEVFDEVQRGAAQGKGIVGAFGR